MKPVKNYALLEPIIEESVNGIYIAGSNQPKYGKVIDYGWSNGEDNVPCSKGDIVLYTKYITEIDEDGKKLQLVKFDDILAIK